MTLQPGSAGLVEPMTGSAESSWPVEIRSFDLHGVTYSDVTVAFPDRSVVEARLGPEAVPDGLQAGDRVIIFTEAANAPWVVEAL